MIMNATAILLYSIVGAVITVYAPYLLVAFARFKLGYDLSAPRAMFERLPPYAQRASWAHQNGFEALSVYTAAVLVAVVTQIEGPWVVASAIAFLVARLLFSVFYILDVPYLRSLMFGVASACSLTLFVLSLLAVHSAL
ncbi:MAG: MAPEG family protein [Spirulina sp. SIO3F2]|nr:MAPEG family protein [Spirulina sp. SIO3F2]